MKEFLKKKFSSKFVNWTYPSVLNEKKWTLENERSLTKCSIPYCCQAYIERNLKMILLYAVSEIAFGAWEHYRWMR